MSSGEQRTYRHRIAEVVHVKAAPSATFDHLDNHERLASHMMQSSSMMPGGAMAFTFDEGHGRALGSHITMTGKLLGLVLDVSEVVTERVQPFRKVWEMTGRPRLLVIGAYRMGFEIEAEGTGSRLNVFIDYDLPLWPSRLLGLIAGRFYARWCVTSMARDAVRRFAT